MRILLITYEYPPVGAGGATAAAAIASELVKLGNTVVVLTGGSKGSPAQMEEERCTVLRLRTPRRKQDRSSLLEMFLFLVSGLDAVPGILREHRIEFALVFFSMPCGPIGWVGRRLTGIPYVISLRGGDVPGAEPSLGRMHALLCPLRRAVLRSSAAVVANSQGLRELAQKSDPFPVEIIPNGVDTSFFAPAATATSVNDRLRILFVGRLREQKNVAFLLEQLAKLDRESFELHLVGDGPQRKFLETRAVELEIDHSIVWHGWLTREALREAYQTADCLVNTSVYEGMSNAMLEGMACALPVVASNIAGNDEVVVDGETGFLFDLKTKPSLFLTNLQRLRDVNLRRRMGEMARARAISLFSWKHVALAYLNLMKKDAGR